MTSVTFQILILAIEHWHLQTEIAFAQRFAYKANT